MKHINSNGVQLNLTIYIYHGCKVHHSNTYIYAIHVNSPILVSVSV